MDSNWGYPLLQLVIGIVPITVAVVGVVLFAARRRTLPPRARALGIAACALLAEVPPSTLLFGVTVGRLYDAGLSPFAIIVGFSALSTVIGAAAFAMLIAAALAGRHAAHPPRPVSEAGAAARTGVTRIRPRPGSAGPAPTDLAGRDARRVARKGRTPALASSHDRDLRRRRRAGAGAGDEREPRAGLRRPRPRAGPHDDVTARVTGDGVRVTVDRRGRRRAARPTSAPVVRAMRGGLRRARRPARRARVAAQPDPAGARPRLLVGGDRGRVCWPGRSTDGASAPRRRAALRLADRLEGHPDNVAPCLLGGFTIAWTSRTGRPRGPARTPSPDAGCRLDVFVPETRALTAAARAALPATVPHADAVFNAGRAALLVHALTADPELLFRRPRTGCTSSTGPGHAGDRRAGRTAAGRPGPGRGQRGRAERAGADPAADAASGNEWICARLRCRCHRRA